MKGKKSVWVRTVKLLGRKRKLEEGIKEDRIGDEGKGIADHFGNGMLSSICWYVGWSDRWYFSLF